MVLLELAGLTLAGQKSRPAAAVSHPCRDETASWMGHPVLWLGQNEQEQGWVPGEVPLNLPFMGRGGGAKHERL